MHFCSVRDTGVAGGASGQCLVWRFLLALR